MFSALAFFMLLPLLKRTRTISIDTDWIYRKGGRLFVSSCDKVFNGINAFGDRIFMQELPKALARFAKDPAASLQKHGVRLLSESTGDKTLLAKRLAAAEYRTKYAAYPIGGGVFLAVMFLGVLSLFYILF